ncbi:Ig-like domain-containing protein [Clostridium thermarum]|uniref:Ig-like domain-containing protein n=1 Tax=Clostridium thermarum TaxID=1716543 RepID=UPI00111EE6CF|nr:Ig-like domain-containing protein [Clostridium thermarum]
MKIIKTLAAFFIGLMALTFAAPVNVNAAAKLQKKLMVESPKVNESYVNKNITVSGWAQDPSGVKEVNIYLNGKLQGKANYGTGRPDVNKVSPGYPQGNNTGYSYTINYANLTTGTYKVTVELVGKDNQKLKKEVNISLKKTVLPLKAALERPANNTSTTANSLNFSGWATGPSGIKEIKVYVDGAYRGSTVPKAARKDVAAIFPTYKDSLTSGFSYELSMLNMTKGVHKVVFEVTGNDGQVTKLERSFEYKGLAPRYGVDSPAGDYETDSFSIMVKGWALNSADISAINVYVDNNYNGQATLKEKRTDIAGKYPGYPQGEDSGFSYKLDMKYISFGKHSLKLEFIAADGTIIYDVRNFTYNKPKAIVSIESPKLNESVSSGTITVSGYALNASGVKDVYIILDETFAGKPEYGEIRTDLGHYADAFPEVIEVGFSHTIDISTLSIGKHDITVLAQGNDGTATTATITFNMHGLVEKVYYDKDLDYYVQRQYEKGANVIFGSSTPPTYEQVKYYMDPENFINDPSGKYMFLKLTYIEGIDVEDLNRTLAGKGVLEGKGQAFLDGGKLYNVNPLYLIAHALLETGNGKSKLATGINVTSVGGVPVEPRVTYNIYGIGARDSNPNVLGSEYAYKQQWFSVDAAIIGGAKFISESYIQNEVYKQYTLYKMKWNFDVIWHEYATDIGWASKQTKSIKALVDQMERPVLVFEVPVFAPKAN